MIKATLQFTSLRELWRFKVKFNASNLTVLEKFNVLIGEFSEMEIQLACTHFQAYIIRKQAVNLI